MCKCCQSLWESCYWHCCEKRFCWDDSIALYEDPDEKKCEYNNNGLDNMAFYDNVALIANRAIFTIEPLPPKEVVPVVTQPKKKLRWFEEDDDVVKEKQRRSTIRGRKMSTVPEEDQDAISVDTIDGNHQEKDKKEEKNEQKGEMETKIVPKKEKREGIVVPVQINRLDDTVVELRRKKLQERRMSKGLTLVINRPEIPVIRHNSMPKFYLDTPEENQLHYTGARTPSVTLTAPIKPKDFEFDLKSVVQIQKDVKSPVENVKPKRTQSVKERILKRQSSNLSVNVNYIASVHI